jgi:hypothetical protein
MTKKQAIDLVNEILSIEEQGYPDDNRVKNLKALLKLLKEKLN